MSEVYIFGVYLSYNANINENRTKTRWSTKWRSQTTVPSGSVVSGSIGDWYYIGDVKICNISDLDYQLKNTDPISDDYWILRYQGAIRVYRDSYIGDSANTRFESVAVTDIVLDVANPNGDRFLTPAPTPKPLILPEFIDFAEERLELGYDYGAVGGASFATNVIEMASDAEQRNSTRVLPLHRFQLGDRSIADSEEDMLTEVSYIKDFHLARLGRKQGFRYKDWNDYFASEQHIGTGDGVRTEFQLRKVYSAGSAVAYRPIQKPVGGTVILFENGIQAQDIAIDSVNGWHINNETGVLTRALALPDSVNLTATFEFDVPVWFETDSIDFSLEYYDSKKKVEMYKLGSVTVVERRLPLAIPFEINTTGEIDKELNLGIIYDTVESFKITNNDLALASGYIKTENKRDDARIGFNLGARNYNRAELDLLLGYFWNARGSHKQWSFKNRGKNYLCRFDTDRLSVKFDASTHDDALFDLQSLKIQVLSKPSIFNLITPDTFVRIFIDTSGSMNSSIPAILTAIDRFKELLVNRVYGSVESMEAKVSQANFGNERWLNLVNENFFSRAVYLIWINEASPIYHTLTDPSPTANYLDDLNIFLENYDKRTLFAATLYSVFFDDQSFSTFQNHLTAANNGESGYTTALADFGFYFKLDIPADTTAERYYQDFMGIKSL